MIQYVSIDGTEYPFKFGMREVYAFTNRNDIEFHQVDDRINGDEQQVRANVPFDALLEIYHLASKKGARKADTPDLELSEEEIEDAMDDFPNVFMDLQEAFMESKAMQKMQEQGEKELEQGNPKPKAPK